MKIVWSLSANNLGSHHEQHFLETLDDGWGFKAVAARHRRLSAVPKSPVKRRRFLQAVDLSIKDYALRVTSS